MRAHLSPAARKKETAAGRAASASPHVCSSRSGSAHACRTAASKLAVTRRSGTDADTACIAARSIGASTCCAA
jgi:hypothetical protein